MPGAASANGNCLASSWRGVIGDDGINGAVNHAATQRIAVPCRTQGGDSRKLES